MVVQSKEKDMDPVAAQALSVGDRIVAIQGRSTRLQSYGQQIGHIMDAEQRPIELEFEREPLR